MASSKDGPAPEFLQPEVRRDGPVTLAEPDPEWAGWYAEEESRIRQALGVRALQIEHVGSTSVPGLAAKPVIDIVLAVADSADEAAYVPDLEAAGYELHIASPSGTSTASFVIITPTSRSTSSASGRRRSSGC